MFVDDLSISLPGKNLDDHKLQPNKDFNPFVPTVPYMGHLILAKIAKKPQAVMG